MFLILSVFQLWLIVTVMYEIMVSGATILLQTAQRGFQGRDVARLAHSVLLIAEQVETVAATRVCPCVYCLLTGSKIEE